MMIVMIIAIPTLALPYPFLRAFGRYYAWSGLWLLRVLCGVSVEWRGREKIPKGGCIVACKHQSMWETFAVFALFWDPTIVIKRPWHSCESNQTHDDDGAQGGRELAPDRDLS
jgi:1-acyl-sn-glycerol-3-phosphate acyltransferase